ncbi:hypothetical protein N7922_22525 [Kosakonia sp. ML.JS2a]|uniref:hypothetical protein n=1 Tax=Kosakonia sp. ML.JS2a TaxID=2980557 RepID=UPI0021DB3191|nr:hypothetical protein [Kosakonia sp. ML.JS2a]UXY10577.1 hypothetical protein N7922_22525 [Kosakonia sp. ML.JS2a]
MKYLHAVVFSIGCQAMLSACSTNVAKNNSPMTPAVSHNIIKAGVDTATTKKQPSSMVLLSPQPITRVLTSLILFVVIIMMLINATPLIMRKLGKVIAS